ncbi:MAG: hypothetical protein PHY16_08730 [Methylobacter sp.]|nr:hypothetical protein [Methylobacter sp.]
MMPDTKPLAFNSPASGGAGASKIRTLIGLFGAPVIWVIQMWLSESLAAYACYPHQAPLSIPVWNSLLPILAVISSLCLTGGLLSGFIAWTTWLRAKPKRKLPGNDKNIPDAGEGRKRFLAMLGLMSSLLFIVAIIFTGCAVIFVSPCSPWF